jgi:hypothetical protein
MKKSNKIFGKIFILVIIIIFIVSASIFAFSYYKKKCTKEMFEANDDDDDDPIDVVYTWVDGSDPVWKNKKDIFFGEVDESKSSPRYNNMDELKYSIRSVYQYANWINKIYIVVDDVQSPKFINIDANNGDDYDGDGDGQGPKIQIVKHSEIIDSKYLPTYNSATIEACIHHIPGLSENFIYCNDDVFFGNYITKEDVYNRVYWHYPDNSFFTPPEMNPKDPQWICSIKNGYWLLKEKYPDAQLIIPPHVACFCKRSLMYEIETEFPEMYEKTINKRIRKTDAECNVILLYKMQCILGVCKGIYTISPTDKMLYSYYEMEKNRDIDKIKDILKSPSKMFCVNNIASYSKVVDDVLSQKFSVKSPYEL